MKISYTVRLTNPIKEVLHVTNDINRTGSFSVKKGKSGINIRGTYVDDTVEIKAYSESYLGETYSLNEKANLQLGTEDYYLVDLEEIFETLSTNISEKPFSKIANHFRLSSDFKIDKFVEKSTDVFLIKIDKDGNISALDGYVKAFSNIIVTNQPIDPTDVVGYFLTSKPLKLDTNDSLFIKNEDLLKVPAGFCKIQNSLAVKHTNSLLGKGAYFEFHSSKQDTLFFTSPVLVDGVVTTRYTIKENEKILIELSNEMSQFTLDNIVNNITLIYEVSPQNTLLPTLALVGKETSLPSDGDIALYTELSGADTEFLKKYIVKEYAISLRTSDNTYTIINSDVLKILTDTSDFEGKILKI